MDCSLLQMFILIGKTRYTLDSIVKLVTTIPHCCQIWYCKVHGGEKQWSKVEKDRLEDVSVIDT